MKIQDGVYEIFYCDVCNERTHILYWEVDFKPEMCLKCFENYLNERRD